MSIKNAKSFFSSLTLTKMEFKIAEQILNEISQRLSFLINVGLEYLTLNRSAMTLSGGSTAHTFSFSNRVTISRGSLRFGRAIYWFAS